MQNIFHYLPSTIGNQIRQLPEITLKQMEEIRIRIDRPIEITADRNTFYLPHIVNSTEAEHLVNKISHHSLYTLEEELKRGYITIEGGHRIGISGKVILDKGSVKAIRDISSFNIRVAREQIGISEKWLSFLYDKGWKHTMIIGPPQTGKTTLLRDIARVISTGFEKPSIPPKKVGIVDERSEIAGCVNGVPQLTFGIRTDVLDGCPKAEGMMMMIRSMSPDCLVVDEIGRKEDTEAILEAVHAGIKLITTTHGESMEEILKRPTLKPIIEQNIFERFIELQRTDGPGTVVAIKDGNGNSLMRKLSVPT